MPRSAAAVPARTQSAGVATQASQQSMQSRITKPCARARLTSRCRSIRGPLDRGIVKDGTLTCHWRHARFDPESFLLG